MDKYICVTITAVKIWDISIAVKSHLLLELLFVSRVFVVVVVKMDINQIIEHGLISFH